MTSFVTDPALRVLQASCPNARMLTSAAAAHASRLSPRRKRKCDFAKHNGDSEDNGKSSGNAGQGAPRSHLGLDSQWAGIGFRVRIRC
jgi:hypothetical protein